MSRWLERDEKDVETDSLGEGLSRGGGDVRPRATHPSSGRASFGANRRERVLLQTRAYHVRPSERAALDVLGRFRVIDAGDLVKGIYGGDNGLARADFEALGRQRLITSVTLQDASGLESQVLTLTRAGHAFARSHANEGQQLYWGYARPAECQHDSHLYGAYRHEERRLLENGSSVKRVVLDYELKRAYFSRLNAPPGLRSYRERQFEAAREVHLPIVDGHVVFPDFRIEYEDERGEPGRVDVEVATGNYRGHHIATKGAAGFRVYGDADAARRFGVHTTPLSGGRFSQERSAVLLI